MSLVAPFLEHGVVAIAVDARGTVHMTSIS